MSRPGVEVTSAATAPPRGVPTDTSVAFVLAEAAAGPVDKPTRITSLDQFTATYGVRVPGTYGFDAVDAAFHEGATTIYYMRLVDGGAAADAGATISDITGGAATCVAASPGVWGNDLTVEVTPAPSMMAAETEGSSKSKRKADEPKRPSLLTFEATPLAAGDVIATVKLAGKAVQTSIPLATNQDLADFLASGPYARLTALVNPTAAPLAGTMTFTGGNDGTVPVASPTALPDALSLMSGVLGPGQVLAPGKTDPESHAALLAHAAGTTDEGVNRFALLDGGATDDALTLTSAAGALRGALEDRYGMLWAPWAKVPGLAPGTFRSVPWSAIQAGICARNDAAGVVNQAGAGPYGISNYATDLTRTFTKREMEDLLYAGVNTARSVYGQIEAYAFRTLVDPAGPRGEWREANHARLNMSLVARSEAIGEDYVFGQIDGRQHLLAAWGGALAGMLITFYNQDELFGDDATEAFVVNVLGPGVNPPDQLADGVIKAVLSVRMSPHAELVKVEIVKVPITVSLAA